MREYLFKAKRVFNGTLGSSKWFESHHLGNVRLSSATVGGYQCYTESLGQYTEFLDEGSKKIFRGDILEWIDTRENYEERDCTGVVEWNRNIGLWEVRNDKRHIYDFLCHVHDHSIVIGTYFDNPELLEEVKNETE